MAAAARPGARLRRADLENPPGGNRRFRIAGPFLDLDVPVPEIQPQISRPLG